jgi:hypothetical protein
VPPLSESLFTADAVIFDRINSTSVRYAAGQEPWLEMSWSGFRELGIWSKPSGAPFLCIEPWRGYASPATFGGEFSDKPPCQCTRLPVPKVYWSVPCAALAGEEDPELVIGADLRRSSRLIAGQVPEVSPKLTFFTEDCSNSKFPGAGRRGIKRLRTIGELARQSSTALLAMCEEMGSESFRAKNSQTFGS